MAKPKPIYPQKPPRVPDTSPEREAEIRHRIVTERVYYTEGHDAAEDLLAIIDRLRGTAMAQGYDLDNVYTYHAPKEGQPERYQAIRDKAKELAQLIKDTTPASREQSLAFTQIEQAVFWANAAIARGE